MTIVLGRYAAQWPCYLYGQGETMAGIWERVTQAQSRAQHEPGTAWRAQWRGSDVYLVAGAKPTTTRTANDIRAIKGARYVSRRIYRRT